MLICHVNIFPFLKENQKKSPKNIKNEGVEIILFKIF